MQNWHAIVKEKNDREIHNILNNIMLDNKLSQRRSNKLLTKKQMKIASDFNQHMIESEFASSTRKFYLQTLRNFLVFVKKDNMKNITKRDIEKYFASLTMVDSSKYTVKLFMRCFFRWVYNSKDGKLPKVAAWIKPKKKKKGKKLPEEMLDLEEIKALAQVANNHRDAAVVNVLYESATRASELLGMQIKHVNLDKYGATIMVDGKTGQRKIRLINSVPSLIKWLNSHPDGKNPDSPLWVNQKAWQKKPFGASGLKLMLTVLKKRAGIKKKVHPHLLRHSRLTELAKNLTEPQLREFAGWDKSSTMPAIYVHLSMKDVDDKLLELAGKKDTKEKEEERIRKEALRPKTCARCGKVSSAESKFCDVCGGCYKELLIREKQKEAQKHDSKKCGKMLRKRLVEKEKLMFGEEKNGQK